MKNRLISAIVCVCMLFTVFAQTPGATAQNAYPFSVTAEYNGKPAENIVLLQNEKKTVSAVCAPGGKGYTYQWQVLADVSSDLWVNIKGQNEQSAELSYAMLSSVLDMSGSAYVRCAVSLDKQTAYSKPVCATVSFKPDIPFEPGENASGKALAKPLAAAKAAASADSEYAFIKVNYLDAQSGNPIYSPYNSQIKKGATFDQIVHSPTFLGFAPYYYPDDLEKTNPAGDPAANPDYKPTTAKTAGTLNFGDITNGAGVNDDVTVNVYYWTIDVPYAVRYFFQNIGDDSYTEQDDLYYVSKAKTGTIIEDKELFEHAGSPGGFTALYHYPEAVAADGSTVFECYYDRNYYMMRFDSAGGFGVEPIYARYDTPFLVNTPVRPGYTFKGWDEVDRNEDGTYTEGDGIPDKLPEFIPAANKCYRALWERATTTVTFVYWIERADRDPAVEEGSLANYTYYKSNQVSGINSGIIIDRTGLAEQVIQTDDGLKYFHDAGLIDHADPKVEVKGDGTTYINLYFDRNDYTLRFYFAATDGVNGYIADKNASGGLANINQSVGAVSGQAWQDFIRNDDGQVKQETVSGRTYYYLELTAQYGENIFEKWPTTGPYFGFPEAAPRTNSPNADVMIGWSAQNTIYNNKQNYVLGPYQILDDTIVSDTSITADKGVATQLVMAFDKANKPCTFNYYFQDINDESVYDLVYSFDLYTTGGWGNQDKAYKYEGFSLNEGKSTQTPSSGECDYYYDRQHYSIEVDNKGTILTDLTLTGLKFGQTTDYFDNLPMQQKYYPKNLEPNSHSFEGFYTTQEFIPGTEFNASTPMPAKSIRLYAHWVPLKHEVRFFETYNDLLKFNETGDESLILQTASGGVMNDPVSLVPHGDVLGAVDFPKYNEGGLEYNFAGWFYMINGVKATYTPLDMPVVRSLNVYADWGTLVAQPYRIKFAEYGTGKKIADDTYGHAYQGSTRTFIPKAGEPFDQLYDGYNTGWFPTLSSHSITIAAEEDKENPINNTFTFEYVKAENIPYMVRYVDKVTGEMLDEKRVEINDKAVVTERFKVFPNMLPDAFYKRLVLSVRVDDKGVPITMPEDNVITFYYTENTGAAPYAVHYMLQKPGTVGDKDEDYQLNSEHAEGMGDIGNEITIYPRQFSGFTMAESAKVLSGGVRVEDSAKFTDGGKDAFSFQVTAEGAEIYVYYKRNSYPYTVRYMLYGTDQKVREDSVYPKEEYDKLITCFAPAIDGYTAIGPVTKSIRIKAHDESSEKDDPNVITFYYITKSYTVEYKVVNDTGGTLDLTLEKRAGENGTYNFTGSVPTPSPGFEFDGWYTDAECKNPADADWVYENNRLIPDVDAMTPEPGVNTYYARFKGEAGSLTITRRGADSAQEFVYKITNTVDPTLTIFVSVTGNGSETIHNLRHGEYIVEQVNDWSWRYSDGEKDPVSHYSEATEVVFNAAADENKKQWLTGNSAAVTNIRGITP